MVTDIITLLSILLMMFLLRNLINVFPSLVACLIRTKEILNLEASVKLSRNRDMIATALIPIFCLLVEKYRMYDVSFLEGYSEDIRFGLILATFSIYLLFRFAVCKLIKPKHLQKNIYQSIENSPRTFFIILTLALLACVGAYSVINIDFEGTRIAMLWISAIIYTIFLIREMQIFLTYCSIFTAFLYLCALEIIPTGTLVVSAIIFS